jgi:hypothetical protein
VFSSRFVERHGAGVPGEHLSRELLVFLEVQLLAVLPLLCWGAGAVLPLLFRLAIPKYVPATGATMILLLTTFFVTVNSGLTTPWFARGDLRSRGLASLASLVLMAGSLLGARAFMGVSIESAAVGALAGYAAYFVMMVFAVGRSSWPVADSVRVSLEVLLAAAWTGLALKWMLPGPGDSIGAALGRDAVGLGALAPLPLYALRRRGLLKRLAMTSDVN